MRARRRRSAVPILLAVAGLGIAACSGSGDGDSSATAATASASDFPDADGRTLEQVLEEAKPSNDIVVSPTGRVAIKGENRYAFGVFDAGREPIDDAQVALYAAPGPNQEAKGPFPASVASLETKPAFVAESTAADPDAPSVFYVTELKLPREGEWQLVALVKDGEGYASTRVPSIDVGAFEEVPTAGEKAPVISTPTEDEVADIAEIDTRSPPSTMHEVDFADVVGKRPTVLLFATPALCQSRVCGPVVDIAEEVKNQVGDDATFIHMEIFKDNEFNEGPRPQVEAYNLPTEPWLFVVDAKGRISTAIEGAFSGEELREAVDEATR